MAGTLAARLRAIVDALPEGASVTFTREQLAALLEEAGDGGSERAFERDLTLAEVGALYGRKPNTVRDWIKHKGLRAYRDATGQWRIPRAALEAWQEAQREGRRVSGEDTDLGAWRRHYRRAG